MTNTLQHEMRPIQHEHVVLEGVCCAEYCEQSIVLYYIMLL